MLGSGRPTPVDELYHQQRCRAPRRVHPLSQLTPPLARPPPPRAGVVLLTEPGRRNPDGDGVRLLIGFPNANSGAGGWRPPAGEGQHRGWRWRRWWRWRRRRRARPPSCPEAPPPKPPPALLLPVAYFNATEGPSRDLVVELDNATLTSVRADGAVGLTVRAGNSGAPARWAGAAAASQACMSGQRSTCSLLLPLCAPPRRAP